LITRTATAQAATCVTSRRRAPHLAFEFRHKGLQQLESRNIRHRADL
jgi:hypothetical protein